MPGVVGAAGNQALQTSGDERREADEEYDTRDVEQDVGVRDLAGHVGAEREPLSRLGELRGEASRR